LQPTSQRLGAGGGITNAWTGDKLSNPHKLSGEPMPRLRQTASYLLCVLSLFFCERTI